MISVHFVNSVRLTKQINVVSHMSWFYIFMRFLYSVESRFIQIDGTPGTELCRSNRSWPVDLSDICDEY